MTLEYTLLTLKRFIERQKLLGRIKRRQREHEKSINSTCASITRMVGKAKAGPHVERVTARRVDLQALMDATFGEGRTLHDLTSGQLQTLYALQVAMMFKNLRINT